MEIIVIGMNRFFDYLWAPLSKSPWYIDLAGISAVSALIFLFIFKKTSNQEMIRQYKNKIFAQILEIRLYKDQPSLTVKTVFSICGYNLIYLRYMLIPLVAILPPVLIISLQLNNRYGYSPIEADQSFIIRADLDKATVSDIAGMIERIRCDTSKGILLETPPLRLTSAASVYWRAKRINSDGTRQFCKISIAGTEDTVKKEISMTDTKQRFSPQRTKWHLRSLLIDNAEDFILEESPFEAVSIHYDRATYPFFTWNMDPIIIYFILTLILGLVFKPMLRVNI